MSAETALGIQYPTNSDDVDVPADMANLAVTVNDLVALNVVTEVGSANLSTDSSTTSSTTESGELFTVAANVINGQKYWVELSTHVGVDNASTDQPVDVRIRVSNGAGSGTQVALGQVAPRTNSSIGIALFVAGEYVAGSTGSVTFAVTLQRNGGSANAYHLCHGTGRNGVFRVVHRTTAAQAV